MPVTIHKQFQLKGHHGAIYALAGFDGNSFFSAGSEGLIAKWSGKGDSDANATAKVKGQIFSLCYIQEDGCLLAGTMDGMLYAIDVAAHKEVHAIDTETSSVFDILFIPESKVYAVASKMGIINFYDNSFNLIHRFNITDNSLRSMVLLPGTHLMAVASSDHSIYLFDYRHNKVVQQLQGPQHSVFSLAVSPGGEYLVAGSRDAMLYAYNLKQDLKLERSLAAHLFTINQILFHPSGKYFFTAGRDKHIKIWDIQTFELLKVIDHEKHEGHVNSVNRLLWLEDAQMLISAGDDRVIMGWRIEFDRAY